MSIYSRWASEVAGFYNLQHSSSAFQHLLSSVDFWNLTDCCVLSCNRHSVCCLTVIFDQFFLASAIDWWNEERCTNSVKTEACIWKPTIWIHSCTDCDHVHIQVTFVLIFSDGYNNTHWFRLKSLCYTNLDDILLWCWDLLFPTSIGDRLSFFSEKIHWFIYSIGRFSSF